MADVVQLVSAYSPAPAAKIRPQILLLAPFFNAVFIYFVFVPDDSVGEVWTTILKCLPIIFLMLYILLKGFNFSASYKTSRCILLGLGLSCAGDALLNLDLFPHGMLAFGVAHVFYISAFGFRPLKAIFGIILYLIGAAIVAVIFKYLEGILIYGVPIYGALLLTMFWRATSVAMEKRDFLSIFCAVGSFLFVFSDSLIVLNMFILNMAHSRIWIMFTYYVAQFSIALSTADENKYSKKSAVKRK